MDHLTWGVVDSTEPNSNTLSWQHRAQTIKKLIDAGFCRKIFLSNDWYFGISIAGASAMEAKERLNPDGMLFTCRKVIPYLKQIGVTEQQVQTMTVDNPRRFFGSI